MYAAVIVALPQWDGHFGRGGPWAHCLFGAAGEHMGGLIKHVWVPPSHCIWTAPELSVRPRGLSPHGGGSCLDGSACFRPRTVSLRQCGLPNSLTATA